MLVLSRKVGEQICIGDDIVLTVLEVQGQRIKLGISAPRSCRVLRGELAPSGEKLSAQPAHQGALWLKSTSDSLNFATTH